VPSGGNLQAIEKSDFWKKSDFFALNKWSGNFRLPALAVCPMSFALRADTQVCPYKTPRIQGM